MFSTKLPFLALAALTSAILLFSGCDDAELYSAWRDRDITIDGNDSDWTGARLQVFDKPSLAIGLMNDRENIYLLVKSRDRSVQSQMAMQGLTVWFDPYGRKKETFGVQYPLGRGPMMPPDGGPGERHPQGWGSHDQGPGEPDRIEETDIGKALERAWQVMITGPEKNECCTLALARAESFGVKARMRMAEGFLVYEFQVPLQEDSGHPYAVAMGVYDTMQVISIGLQTGGSGRPEGGHGPSGRGMGMPPSSGRGGRPGGMMGGRGPGGMPEALEYWAKVALRLVPPKN
jgi:hypothetical protein